MGSSREALAVVSAAMFAGAEFRPSYHQAAPWQVSAWAIAALAR